MTLFKDKYRVETTRLKNWDYASEAYYFVTICVKNKKKIFGKIENGIMNINKIGKIIKEKWENIKALYSNSKLYQYIIMPDHIHGIVYLNNVETGPCPRLKRARQAQGPVSTKNKSLSNIIGEFKSITTLEINHISSIKGKIWQAGFYDHIIRDEFEFYYIEEYIKNNPIKHEIGTDDIIYIKQLQELQKDKARQAQGPVSTKNNEMIKTMKEQTHV